MENIECEVCKKVIFDKKNIYTLHFPPPLYTPPRTMKICEKCYNNSNISLLLKKEKFTPYTRFEIMDI